MYLSDLVKKIEDCDSTPINFKDTIVHLDTWTKDTFDQLTDQESLFRHYLIDITCFYLLSYPEESTLIGIFDVLDYENNNINLNDLMSDKEFQNGERLFEYYNYVKKCDVEPYQTNIWKRVLLNYLGQQVIYHRKSYHLLKNYTSCLSNPVQQIVQVLKSQRVTTPDQLKNFMTRYQGVKVKINQLLIRIQYQMAGGYYPHYYILKNHIDYLRQLITSDDQIRQSVWYKIFDNKVKELEIDNKKYYYFMTTGVIKNQIFPKIKELIVFYEDLLSHSDQNDPIGLCNIMKLNQSISLGKEYYQWRILYSTGGTNLDPEQIHQRGLKELDKLISQFDKLVESLKQTSSLGYLNFLQSSNNFRFKSEQQVLDKYNLTINKLTDKLQHLFSEKLSNSLKIEIINDDHSPRAFYSPPTTRDNDDGTLIINFGANLTLFEVSTLVSHEAMYGHHYQLSRMRNNKQLPLFFRIGEVYGKTHAYVEGWGVYAEYLAFNNNCFETLDEKMGYFQYQMLRLIRLIVDTGIHWYGWSFDQAYKFMNKYLLMIDKSDIEFEIYRCISEPAHSLSYQTGFWKILEMRDNFMDSTADVLSSQDQIIKFHDIILNQGAIPMGILSQVVDHEIDRLHDLNKLGTDV